MNDLSTFYFIWKTKVISNGLAECVEELQKISLYYEKKIDDIFLNNMITAVICSITKEELVAK